MQSALDYFKGRAEQDFVESEEEVEDRCDPDNGGGEEDGGYATDNRDGGEEGYAADSQDGEEEAEEPGLETEWVSSHLC